MDYAQLWILNTFLWILNTLTKYFLFTRPLISNFSFWNTKSAAVLSCAVFLQLHVLLTVLHLTLCPCAGFSCSSVTILFLVYFAFDDKINILKEITVF